METITLEELTRTDAMMTRVDRKYLLSKQDACLLYTSDAADE